MKNNKKRKQTFENTCVQYKITTREERFQPPAKMVSPTNNFTLNFSNNTLKTLTKRKQKKKINLDLCDASSQQKKRSRRRREQTKKSKKKKYKTCDSYVMEFVPKISF